MACNFWALCHVVALAHCSIMPPGRLMSFTSSYWSEKLGHPLKSFLAVTKPKSYVSNSIHSAQKLDPRQSPWCWCRAGCLQQRIRAEKEFFDWFSGFNPKFQQFQNVQDTSILQGAFETSFISPFNINYVLVVDWKNVWAKDPVEVCQHQLKT